MKRKEISVIIFCFGKHEIKGVMMQYKLYRFADALYPRKFSPKIEYDFENFGTGTVISTKPHRDAQTHEKFWITEVTFQREDGSSYEHIFKCAANDNAIQMFNGNNLPKNEDFRIAEWNDKFALEKQEAECNVYTTISKCDFSDEDKTDWDSFFASRSSLPTANAKPFLLPAPQPIQSGFKRHAKVNAISIDNGVRSLDIVTHSNFKFRKQNLT
jgi:hypothetical protein